MSCPTCGKFLGDKIKNFEDKKELICKNPKLTEEDKGEEIQKLINSLNFRRYCCKMRLMTYKDMVYEILPIPKK
tara:strand:+ start:362 stop:583 length:222 start_codon:yes stop_codon:yes gene_type:complete